MAEEMIRIALGDYPRYEELLLRRDKLQKEALQYYEEYIRIFGRDIIDVFEIKIDCIRLKKTIERTQAMINRGIDPDAEAIAGMVESEMTSYYEQLERLIGDHEASLRSKVLSEYDVLKIRKIYREIAKMIHPDINPETEKDQMLMELWNRVVIAYKCNNLKDLEELQVMISRTLTDKGIDTSKIVVEDIEDKIRRIEEEIKTILSTDPYNYRYVLNDPEATAQKKEALQEEKKQWEDYRGELRKVLDELTGG